MPDFRTRTPAIDPMAFANVLQRKAAMEQEQKNTENQRKYDRFNGLIQAVQAGQQIAGSMMTLAEKRNKAKATEDISAIQQEPSADPILTPTRSQRLLEAISRRSPETFDTAMLASMKQSVKDPNYQSKSLLYNGEPKEVLFNPDPKEGESTYLDPDTRKPLHGKFEPIPAGNSRSEQMEQNRIQRTSEKMGQDLNDLDIGSNSPAGISAKRALYAKSGLQLIKQAESQPGGVDKRQMAELQTEVARVLTGAGVITNEQLNNLATNTARSKVANWEEWFTNKPTGVDQQKFVERFKETLDRQLSFHQGELDKNKQARMAKYANFAKKYPDEFNAVLDQAGYDSEAFKKTKKLSKLVDETPSEFKQLGSNPQLDAIASVLHLPKKRK